MQRQQLNGKDLANLPCSVLSEFCEQKNKIEVILKFSDQGWGTCSLLSDKVWPNTQNILSRTKYPNAGLTLEGPKFATT